MKNNSIITICKVYQYILVLLCSIVCILSIYIYESNSIHIEEMVLILCMTFFVLIIVKSKWNWLLKQTLLFLIFIFYYLQFVNLNIDIKYLYDDTNIPSISLLYLFYSCDMLYVMFSQWLSIILMSSNNQRFIDGICISMLSIILTIGLLLFIPSIDIYVSMSHILLFYMPLCNYIMLFVVKSVRLIYSSLQNNKP